MKIQTKQIVALLLSAAFMVVPAASALAAAHVTVQDDETVYGLLNETGSVHQEILVDWIRVRGKGAYTVRDPLAGGRSVRLVMGDAKLAADGDAVTLSGSVNGTEDQYYRAVIGKPLPFGVAVTTRLNGKKVNYSSLEHATGLIQMNLQFVNHDRVSGTFRPWTISSSWTMDSGSIADVRAEGGNVTNVGGKTTISFTTVLDATSTVSLTYHALKGTDPGLQIVVIPYMPDVPTADISRLGDLETGLTQLGAAFDAQQAVLTKLAASVTAQTSGASADLSELSKLNDLATLLQADEQILQGVYGSIDETKLAQLDQIPQGASRIHDAVVQTQASIDKILPLLESYAKLVDTSLQLNQGLQQTLGADSFATKQQAMTMLRQQQQILSVLKSGGTPEGLSQTIPGLEAMTQNLQQLRGGLATLEAQTVQFAAATQQVPAVGQGLRSVRQTLGTVLNGGTIQGRRLPSLSMASRSIAQASPLVQAKVTQLTKQFKGSAVGISGILNMLVHGGTLQGRHMPGTAELKSGTVTMKNGLHAFRMSAQSQIDTLNRKKALARSCTTFMGGPANAAGSSVRFILKMN